MTRIETYIVDSFTDQPFHVNPAGVCIPQSELCVEKMQAIANEWPFSETSFINNSTGQNKYSKLFFLTTTQIPLSEHATLASSKVMFEKCNTLLNIVSVNTQGIDLTIAESVEDVEMQVVFINLILRNAFDELLDYFETNNVYNSKDNKVTLGILVDVKVSTTLYNKVTTFENFNEAHVSISGFLDSAISKNSNYDVEIKILWPLGGTNQNSTINGSHTFLIKYVDLN